MTNTTAPTDAEIDRLLAMHWPAVFVTTESVIQGWLRNAVREAVSKWGAPAPASGEPFGYFRAAPFGWTDCAATDEGAIALYEKPQAPEVRVPLSDDNDRLNWLLWKLPGDALRYVVGDIADTSSGAEFRAAIDAAMAAQGVRV